MGGSFAAAHSVTDAGDRPDAGCFTALEARSSGANPNAPALNGRRLTTLRGAGSGCDGSCEGIGPVSPSGPEQGLEHAAARPTKENGAFLTSTKLGISTKLGAAQDDGSSCPSPDWRHWPTPSPSPSAGPSPSPSPSSDPTSDPSPTPTPPSGGSYTYNGCGWPSGDYYNLSVVNDSVDTYSATMIANAPTGNFNDDSSSLEKINLASKSTTLYTVGMNGGHSPPMSNGSGTQVPWASGFFIEPASDAHSVTLDTQTCMDSEMVQTKWYPSGGIAAYDGFNMNLNDTLKSQQSLQMDNVTASGEPMFGAIDWGEDAALVPGPNHVVQMLIYGPTNETGGQDLSQYGYVPPGNRGSDTPDTGCGGDPCPHPLHYGDVLRLQSSYTCSSSWSQPAQALCWQLKNYGMIISDAAGENGIRFGLSANGSDPWDPFSSVMAPFLSNLTLSNFDVMQEAEILCEAGHTYGVDCF
jgi:hypothetical protein